MMAADGPSTRSIQEWRAGVGSPAIGLGGGVVGKVVGEKAVEAGGREVLDIGKPYTSGLAVFDLDRTGDRKLAFRAAPTAAGDGILPGAAGEGCFVGFDQALERRSARCHHGKPEVSKKEPGGFVRPETELLLLLGGDAIGMAGHQIGSPEPDGEAELRAVHDGACGHRGLFVAAGKFERERLGFKRPGPHAAPSRANEALRPACFDRLVSASALIGKALLELQE